MRFLKTVLATMLLGLTFSSAPVFARSEVDVLLDKLVEKDLLTPVEAGLVRREISDSAPARTKDLTKEVLPKWVQNMNIKGDIRLRNEFRDRTGTGNDKNRQRIRFRLGINSKIGDDLEVGARFATGSLTDPVSTNQSFNDSFQKDAFNLDRAYVKWSPDVPVLDSFNVQGGIIGNPFYGVSPLVWDGDLNFEGAATQFTYDAGPAELFVHAGGFSLDTDEGEAGALWSVQGGTSLKPFADSDEELLKKLKMKAAVAYHDYMNDRSTENDVIANAGGASGNTAAAEGFDIINVNGEIGSQFNGIPFKVYGDYVHNLDVVSGGQDDGYLFGVKVGKAKKPFDLKQGWEAGYFYEKLESDATFGPFTDSDFGGGGTNNKGHKYWVKLAVLKNSTLQATYIDATEVTGSKSSYDTLQVDWVTKF